MYNTGIILAIESQHYNAALLENYYCYIQLAPHY